MSGAVNIDVPAVVAKAYARLTAEQRAFVCGRVGDAIARAVLEAGAFNERLSSQLHGNDVANPLGREAQDSAPGALSQAAA